MFHLQMMKYTIDKHTFVYICMSTVFVYVPSNLGHREITTRTENSYRCSNVFSLHADTIKKCKHIFLEIMKVRRA